MCASVMHFEDVAFEIDPDTHLPGSFYVCLRDEDYFFEWVPLSKTDLKESDCIEETLRVVFRLCELSAIIKSGSAMSIAIMFLTDEGEKLPLFHFRNAAAQIAQFLEFFEHKGMITESVTDQFMVNVPFTELATPLPRKSFLKPKDAVLIAQHRQIVKTMVSPEITFGENEMDVSEAKSYFSEDGICSNFVELKRQTCQRGLTNNARCFLWPYFLGVADHSKTFAQNKDAQNSRLREYQILKKQWQCFLDEQKKTIRGISELIRVVKNDVKRNDRTLPQFSDDDSVYLRVLNDILVTYGVYNKDCGYVQGMGDIISPIMVIYITEWRDETTAVLWDGTTLDRLSVESEMFWLLTATLSQTQLDRLMTDMMPQQQFLLERACSMATRFHPPLLAWLNQTENTSLLFIYRPYLLLYKRDFPADTVLRLWDSFFASPSPSCFHRYFTAAILIELYPKFLLYTNGSLGDVVQITDSALERLNPLTCLAIATHLEKQSRKDLPHVEWELQDLPIDLNFIDYVPSLLHCLYHEL